MTPYTDAALREQIKEVATVLFHSYDARGNQLAIDDAMFNNATNQYELERL